MPAFEDYVIVLESDAVDQRLLLLEGLATPGAESPGAGRDFHGNAVLTSVTLEERDASSSDAAPDADGEEGWRAVPLSWAWADHTQKNLDFEPTQVLIGDDQLGWAFDGNALAAERDLLLLADEPFGAGDGAELRVTVAFRSRYAQHSLGRVRCRTSALAATSALPVAAGRWYAVGPFEAPPGGEVRDVYDIDFGPETLAEIDLTQNFGAGNQYWTFDGSLADGVVSSLGSTQGARYVGRTLWSPDARDVEIALGSDDGFQLFLNGELVVENRVDRGPALDQDRATLSLRRGANAVVMKVVNTGGPSGFAWEAQPGEGELVGELASALLPRDAVGADQDAQAALAWRRTFFDGYRELDDARAAAVVELDEAKASIPLTMVMSELEEPRETFVLMRGQYDHPDTDRPVERATPAFLPPLPADAPADRAGLAAWLVDADNPLFARVAVNRFWEQLFGAGLVRTSEDFGLQGDWPTHPELLDWLAVEFRESGWDLRALLAAMVSSRTYRQASAVRDDLVEHDPENRLLAAYPRRRLSAEQIRDLALYTSGLLVERFGGPPVKPYQPEGLWQEVSMLQSNTRTFERDSGDALWRRSLYTYWKRAVPPPSLLTFDAPTRESCVIRRQSTNTPLQALVLWNDAQFVEASRVLAARVLRGGEVAGASMEAGASDPAHVMEVGTAVDDDAAIDDAARLVELFRIATGRVPDDEEQPLLADALADFRERFADDPAAAEGLVSVGEAPRATSLDPAEHAAWTMLCNAVLNLHETLTQD